MDFGGWDEMGKNVDKKVFSLGEEGIKIAN
jgi:hypothetical protein